MDKADSALGLLLSDDMIFSSRITGTARALGLDVKPAKSVQILETLVQNEAPTCVIIDLGNPGLRIEELIKKLRDLIPPPRIVAYGSHVDAATLRTAKEAGCDIVLPRSRFIEELPNMLPAWLRVGSER